MLQSVEPRTRSPAPRSWPSRSVAGAVLLSAPGQLGVERLTLRDPDPDDVVVAVRWSGISSGTEKLLYTGEMPPFPGMGYPLVPGYEAVGDVVWAGPESGRQVGERVFVPGANCFEAARGLFGAAAQRLVIPGLRAVPVDPALGPQAVLLALAATAEHIYAAACERAGPPALIVGHGVLGRLLARLCIADGRAPPTVWEAAAERMPGARGYRVSREEDDPRTDYGCVVDVSGDAGLLDRLVARLAHRGELVLGGFYARPLSLSFPGAFMREARISVAAEWQPRDLQRVTTLIGSGALALDGLITHTMPAAQAAAAYPLAFQDPRCVKLILDWRGL